jgi:uncharacterized protein (TIGR03083 family)
MDSSRFLACLETDYRRLRDIVPGHLDHPVPTCPGWTVASLTRHVGQTYLHKVEMMRHGQQPDAWPPDGFATADPVRLLDQGYADLTAEFAARDPGDTCPTWYGPDQTVGFWIRRMAQETVIHRMDAELGAGAPVRPAPDDLAVDGVDELLKVFAVYAFAQWPEDFSEVLRDSPGRTFTLRATPGDRGPGISWRVQTGPGRLTAAGGPGGMPDQAARSDVTVSGAPSALLRWVWNREAAAGAPGQASSVRVDGAPAAVAEFRGCMTEATQ